MYKMSRAYPRLVLVLAFVCFFARSAVAHPGSGIVADRQGQIYFLDTGAGLWKIDAHGILTQISSPRFHWMTLDAGDAFRTVRLPSGSGEITRVSATPALLLASDVPIAMGREGTLLYPSRGLNGGLRIIRLTPSGRSSDLATLRSASAHGPLEYVNGLATGPDGSVYCSEDDAIQRVTPRGQVSVVVKDLTLTGCASIPGNEAPYLRGLAVDAHDTLYVAASGCGRVLKVTPDGRVSSVIQTQSPWSPTAVTLFGGDIYALEYLHTAGEDRRAWVPRVRKISQNGTSTVIATIDRR